MMKPHRKEVSNNFEKNKNFNLNISASACVSRNRSASPTRSAPVRKPSLCRSPPGGHNNKMAKDKSKTNDAEKKMTVKIPSDLPKK